jgi:hypothetical protein
MIDAMKQALEALEDVPYMSNKDDYERFEKAQAALRLAIEQAEKQEPVAWDVFELRLYGAPQEKQHRVLWVDRYTHPDGSTPDLDGILEAATKDGGIDGGAKTLYVRPLYTTPPQRQPLTEEQIDAIWDEEKVFANPYEIARAIERKHGIGGEHD